MKLEDEIQLSGRPSDFARALVNTVWSAEFILRHMATAKHLVHCHIPKTAGVTFYGEFKRHMKSFHADHRDVAGSIKEFFDSDSADDTLFFTGHFRAHDLVKNLKTTSLVVCPIRHPIERLVSHFNYNSSEASPWFESFRRDFPTIDSFVESDIFANNPMCRQLFSGFNVDPDGFNSATGVRTMFYFATQENISNYIATIRRVFSLREPDSQTLPAKNVTPETAKLVKVDGLSEDTLERIKKRNQVDLKFYWAVKKAEDIRSSFARP